MQPEVMLFMLGMVFATIKAAAMTVEYWRDRDKGE